MAWHEKDKAGKWMLDHQAGALLRLAGIRDVRSWRTRQAETVHPGQLPDGLLEVMVANRPKPALVLMEIGVKAEPRMVRQLQRGMQLVHLDRGELPEVVAVVLRPHGHYRLPRHVSIASPLGLARMEVEWHVVEMWMQRAEDLLASNDVGAVPWAPLARFDGPPDQLLRECRERIERQAPENQREQLLAVTKIMASVHYNDPSLLSILFGSTSMIKWSDFPVIKEALAEAREEARDKSALKTGQKYVIQALHARFKRVPKTVVREVEAIDDAERLAELHALAATCPDLDTFRAELTR